MVGLIAVLISFVLFVNVTPSSVNYCGCKMCANTNAHTFCQYMPGPSPDCIGYIEAPLSDDEKVRIVARLNRRRSEAARGLLKKLPTASNMLKMRWVEELAREAQLWADQCRPVTVPEEKDSCRDLYAVTVGQNVASVVGEAPGLKPETLADMWHMQSLNYKENLTYLHPTKDIHYYGDFGQMIWSKTYMVGCARSRFMAPVNGRLRSVERLVCNMAPRGPSESRLLWNPGTPASSCPRHTEPDTDFPGLCAHLTSLNYGNETNLSSASIEDDILLHTIMEVEKNTTLNYIGGIDEFYLTRIAVASYLTGHDKEFLGTVNRQDTVYKFVETDNNNTPNNEKYLSNITGARTVKPKIKYLKRLNNKGLIGRPKPYDIDYLNEVGGEPEIDNIHTARRKQNEIDEGDDETDEDVDFDDDNKNFVTDSPIEKKQTTNYEKILFRSSNKYRTPTTSVYSFPIVYSRTDANDNYHTQSIPNTHDIPNVYTLTYAYNTPDVYNKPNGYEMQDAYKNPVLYTSRLYAQNSHSDIPTDFYPQYYVNKSETPYNNKALQTNNAEYANGVSPKHIFDSSNKYQEYKNYNIKVHYVTNTDNKSQEYVTKESAKTVNNNLFNDIDSAEHFNVNYTTSESRYESTQNDIDRTLMNATATMSSTKTEEEYLSDPETVEQLQEALDRMEKELADSTPKQYPSLKVRRDLSDKMGEMMHRSREYYPPRNGNEISFNDTKSYDPRKYYPVNKSNLPKKEERSPVFNMVMKYLPSYLGSYKQQLRDFANDSVNLASSIITTILTLIICL